MIGKRLLLFFLAGITLAWNAGADPAAHSAWAQPVPLRFTENKGQVTDQHQAPRPDIDFRIAGGKGLNVFIGSGRIYYQWSKTAAGSGTTEMYRMDVLLVGANRNAEVIREDKQPYSERYYSAHADVLASTFRKITYREIYPGIDWVLYINGDKVEYDFVVRPGGKVSDIRMKYEGAGSLTANEDGSITAVTETGSVTQRAPYSFQHADRRKVRSAFLLKDDMVSFSTGSYEGTLVIDPVLEWGVYYGGNSMELPSGLSTDNTGNVYMTGPTSSTNNIATTGSFKATLSGSGDVFLVKFSAAGARLWGTYFGGPGSEDFATVSCDNSGNVYIGGMTTSTSGIATPGAHRSAYVGGSEDAFLAKFDGSGNRLWSTYYGGASSEQVMDIDFDAADNVYVSGITSSDTGIATPNGFQTARRASSSAPLNAFLARFSSSGVREWATYYGGRMTTGTDVYADKSGYIYMAGTAQDTAMATPGAHQVTYATGRDYYLVKFDTAGSRIWATYYGGTGTEGGYAMPDINLISGDNEGNIYLSGTTSSADSISTPGSYQPVKNGAAGIDFEGLLAKFDSSGKRQWGTYYGGPGGMMESVLSIATDHAGNIYLAGMTESTTGIATPGSYRDVPPGGGMDGYMAQFSSDGARQWATYYGGGAMDAVLLVDCDNDGNVYIAGMTQSDTGIATPGSPLFSDGGGDCFVAKFCFAIQPASVTGNDTICANMSYTYSVPDVPGAGIIWEWPSAWTASHTGNQITVLADSGGVTGVISARVVKCGDTSEVKTFEIYVRPVVPAVIAVNGFELSTVNTHASYQWYRDGQAIPGAVSRDYLVDTNGSYSVKVINADGCADSSEAYSITNVSVPSTGNRGSGISVYPNPAQNTVHILSARPVTVHISSMDGKCVLQQNAPGALDIGRLSGGIYLIRVYAEDHRLLHMEKLVKSSR